MIRPALHTLVGCLLSLPLILIAMRSDGGTSREPADRGAETRTAYRDAAEFLLADYEIKGAELARKQIQRGLRKQVERNRLRDQSFEGLRDIIRQSQDGELHRFLPTVAHLESVMELGIRDPESNYVEGFIRDLAPIATYLERETGLPASVIIAQIITESGWGASNVTILKNNVLGIGNCRERGEFQVQVELGHVSRDVRVRCMLDTSAFKFDSVGDSIYYYVYLLLQNESNVRQYGPLRNFVRENRAMAARNPDAYLDQVIRLIARGYHSNPEYYEQYLREIIATIEDTAILAGTPSWTTTVADAAAAR
jgi:flagellum-specific peptidoglycan hydrolase FlgJ